MLTTETIGTLSKDDVDNKKNDYEKHTGEYWPEVVAVPTSLSSVCTAMFMGQYFAVCTSRPVSKLLVIIMDDTSYFDNN